MHSCVARCAILKGMSLHCCVGPCTILMGMSVHPGACLLTAASMLRMFSRTLLLLLLLLLLLPLAGACPLISTHKRLPVGLRMLILCWGRCWT